MEINRKRGWKFSRDGVRSAARDAYERHARTFEINRISVPGPEEFRGADYLDAFDKTIDIVREWAERNV